MRTETFTFTVFNVKDKGPGKTESFKSIQFKYKLNYFLLKTEMPPIAEIAARA